MLDSITHMAAATAELEWTPLQLFSHEEIEKFTAGAATKSQK
jgi:hypothetical protein